MVKNMNHPSKAVLKPGLITPSHLAELLGGISLQAVYKQLRSCGATTQSLSNRRRVVEGAEVRRLLEARGFRFSKQNIAFQIVKGGVGKTTLSYALSTRANHYGARVLAIDLDQQGNLTRSFNVDARNKPVWLHMVKDDLPAKDAVVKLSESLHLLPSNLNNSRLDVELSGQSANLRDMVRDKLEPIRDRYDLVVIDCPPAINKINTAAACGSDTVIVPINADQYAMDGLDFSIAELKRIKKEFKVKFQYKVIWNRYDARERLGVMCMHDVAKSEHSNNLLPVVIRIDTSMKNAIYDCKSIFEMSKKSSAQEDADQFAREILGLNAWKERRAKSVA